MLTLCNSSPISRFNGLKDTWNILAQKYDIFADFDIIKKLSNAFPLMIRIISQILEFEKLQFLPDNVTQILHALIKLKKNMIQKLDLEQILESIQGRIILKQKQLFIQTFLCIPWTIDMQQIIREMRQMTALVIKSIMNHPALQGKLLTYPANIQLRRGLMQCNRVNLLLW